MAEIAKIFFVYSVALVLSSCSVNSCDPIPAESFKQSEDIKVFFTPGIECEKNIIANINKADKIDIAVYSITNPAIVDSILAAHKRGAQIRVITDRSQAKGKGSLVGQIRSSGIPVVTNIKHKIEHNKVGIFDDRYIVTGSYNWPTNASSYNSENCVFFDQPEGMEYSKRFEYLWQLYSK